MYCSNISLIHIYNQVIKICVMHLIDKMQLCVKSDNVVAPWERWSFTCAVRPPHGEIVCLENGRNDPTETVLQNRD